MNRFESKLNHNVPMWWSACRFAFLFWFLVLVCFCVINVGSVQTLICGQQKHLYIFTYYHYILLIYLNLFQTCHMFLPVWVERPNTADSCPGFNPESRQSLLLSAGKRLELKLKCSKSSKSPKGSIMTFHYIIKSVNDSFFTQSPKSFVCSTCQRWRTKTDKIYLNKWGNK